MNIRLPIIQIPSLWEQIKFVAITTDNISCENMQKYCTNLLIKLLTNQTQVIIRLDKKRKLLAMMLIDYSISSMTEEKTLHFKNFYSWKSNTLEEWQEAFSTIRLFAKEENCDFIEAISYNKKIWELAEDNDFKETSRQYILPL